MFYFVSNKDQAIEYKDNNGETTQINELTLGQILHSCEYDPSQHSDIYDIVELDGILYDSVTGKFSPDKISQDELDAAIFNMKLKKSQAVAVKLLLESDWRATIDKFAEYTTEQQESIISYRAQLREVMRGNSTTIPELVL